MNNNYQVSPDYQMMQKAPGSGLMKVTGILMIVFGSIGIVTNLLTMASAGIGGAVMKAFAGSSDIQTKLESLFDSLSSAYLIALIGAALTLVAGILALVNSKKPGKGMVVIIFCALVIILNIAFNVMQMLTYGNIKDIVQELSNQTFEVSGFGFSNILAILAGIALPVLAIIGTLKNKKAVQY